MNKPAKTVYYWTGGEVDAYDEDHVRVCANRDPFDRPTRTDAVALIRHLAGRKGVTYIKGTCTTTRSGKGLKDITMVKGPERHFWNWVKTTMPEKFIEAGVVA